MSVDRRVALLRRLAASTPFDGEREAALAKAAELEAKGKVAKPATEHRPARTIFDPVGDGDPLEVDLGDDSDPIWERVPFNSPWANFGHGSTVVGYAYRPREDSAGATVNGAGATAWRVDTARAPKDVFDAEMERLRRSVANAFGVDPYDL